MVRHGEVLCTVMEPDVTTPTTLELAAAFLQAGVTLGLAGLFAFLYRRYRKPYFGWFALAWLLYVLRLGAIISFLLSQNRIWLYWHQVATGWTALALLWAALVFSQQLRWRRQYLLLVLFPPLWSYVAIYRMDNFLLAAAPAVAFLSVATVWTGWAFLRYHRRVRSVAAVALAVALFLWGIHHFDYPFLRARGAWNPWGYYLDLLFVLAMGAGTLLLVLEDLERGVEALSALSGQLQRGGSEHEIVTPLLESTLTLAGVRGSAMFQAGAGRYTQGVGLCAGWAGREAWGPAGDAIRRTLASGRAELAREPDAAPGSERPEYAYAAALPVLRDDAVAGALVIVGDARDPFAALDSRILVALGQQVGAALENADLDRRLESRTAELERLAARMIRQHEDERRRLSRELHDETAQVFTAVKLELGLLRERAAADAAPRLDRSLELIDAGMRSIRNVTDHLRPSVLDELGLIPALRALVREFGARGDLAIDLEAPARLPPLSEGAEVAVFRALQEALANVSRHASARHVDVRLSAGNGTVVLQVTDDGRGLPPGARLQDFERAGHLGLAGMRERIQGVGGTVRVSEAPHGGVTVTVNVPAEPGAAE
jgi:signal transduction histidine kinase